MWLDRDSEPRMGQQGLCVRSGDDRNMAQLWDMSFPGERGYIRGKSSVESNKGLAVHWQDVSNGDRVPRGLEAGKAHLCGKLLRMSKPIEEPELNWRQAVECR
jgi:hypothetical protein